jgi:hypothetical protein
MADIATMDDLLFKADFASLQIKSRNPTARSPVRVS